MSIKKAVFWVGFWFCMAMLFNAGIWFFGGQEKAVEFLGGYVIEQSLSIDNLFVFLMIFASFRIEEAYQKRVLTFGIVGAMILRLLFIFAGISVVNMFHWVLYIFGFILILSGIKMLLKSEEDEKDHKNSKVLKFLKKIMPFTDDLYEDKFFIRKKKILYATPLFAILIIIECSDIIFAIDSIPAILSFTKDLFIVYTSNVFAILGLRSMYFLLEKMNSIFRFMKFGVAFILAFTGVKLSLPILGHGFEINDMVSIIVIVGILGLSILASVVIREKKVAI